MSSLLPTTEAPPSAASVRTTDSVLRVIELLPSIREASCAESVIAKFGQLLRLLGADSSVFISAMRDDAARTSIRSLLVCDPRWVIEYSQQGWHQQDPWLRHAMESQAPVRAHELLVHPWEEDFVQAASRLGFASAVIVPAPTNFGAARVGVLVLGSNDPARFDSENLQLVQIVARALAMELHECLLGIARKDLLERSRITPDQIELLLHEAAGHSSKKIAAELGINPKAVDRRFQRLCEKLDAPDRRIAVRVARLYNLI